MAGRGRGGGGRGRGGGGGAGGAARGRGGVPLVGRGSGPALSATSSTGPAAHVQTVGVRKKEPGTAGTAIKVSTNHFAVDIPDFKFIHYDGMFFVRVPHRVC